MGTTDKYNQLGDIVEQGHHEADLGIMQMFGGIHEGMPQANVILSAVLKRREHSRFLQRVSATLSAHPRCKEAYSAV